MVSTRPPTSKSSRPFNNPLVTVSKAPIIIVTLMFHSLFQFPSTVKVFILLFTFFQFYSVVSRDRKVDNFADFLFFSFLLIIIRSGLRADIRWSVRISKSHRSLCESFSRTGSGLCIFLLSSINVFFFLWLESEQVISLLTLAVLWSA